MSVMQSAEANNMQTSDLDYQIYSSEQKSAL